MGGEGVGEGEGVGGEGVGEGKVWGRGRGSRTYLAHRCCC